MGKRSRGGSKTGASKAADSERYELAPGDHVCVATGFADRKVQLRLLNQLIVTLQTFDGEPAKDRAETLLALLAAIGPKDGVEGLLAAQMVATHEHAMECFRRAMLSGQSFEGRNLNLKHAAKLLQMYARQTEALDKHRGKGQQKITVEHVTVEAGGQAIVGNVETRTVAQGASAPAQLGQMADVAPGSLARRPDTAPIATEEEKGGGRSANRKSR